MAEHLPDVAGIVPTEAPALSSARSAYIHVPFCRHRCGYCDFTLVARRDELVGDYLDALERELASLGTPRSIRTLFLGGGTPTHLSAAALDRLFALLRRWLPWEKGAEVSVEANPSGLDDARLEVLRKWGVNRISLGVQSFDARHLATLERDHRPEDVREVVERLRRWCGNVSLDLIFAVPGQTLDDWEATLGAAIELRPEHVSTYGLTWERGTAYWARRGRGLLQPVEEEIERAMYALAMDRLGQAGIEQYELSNFARPGCECRHNRVYWRGESYYGFGPGAASYLEGVRRLNHRSVTTWIRRVLADQPALYEEECLSTEERAREAIMLGLRQMEGIDLARFAQRFGSTPRDLNPRAYAWTLEQQLCEESVGAWRLTREGRFVADKVIGEFL